MITFSTESKPLILKPIVLKKFCSVCVKDAADFDVQWCPDCLHPYDNNESLLDFDYDDYRHYSGVNSEKARLFFIANAVLNQCRFCGCDPLLQSKTLHLYDRYYGGEFKDTVNVEAFFLDCKGCTFATPLLYLYLFYAAYMQLVYSWNGGKSRLPLIKYVDLRLPDWSINYHNLKRIKGYADDYRQNLQQSLF